MRTFRKTFLKAFLVQALFILVALLTGVGDIVLYLAYGIPFFIVDSIIPLPKQVGTDAVTAYLLFCLPAAMYAVVFAFLRVAFAGFNSPKGVAR
jgi:hypothetical protein